MSENADIGCKSEAAEPYKFGFAYNFLIAVAICIIILLILLLAVVVHRRKTDDHNLDMDDQRETIISYQEEGGGEGDTAYDLNVLREMCGPMSDLKFTPSSLCKGK